MVSPADIPRADAPIAANGGYATRAWVDFFLKLASAESSENLAQLYQALAERVSELEDGESLNFQLLGQGSISVNGIPQPGGAVIVTLSNDSDAPGNTAYYGTGPAGVKGWNTVSGAVAVTGDMDKAVGPDGVTTLGLSAGTLASLALADTALQSIVAGAGVSVDNSDPQNPVVSATGAVSIQFPFYDAAGDFEPIPLTSGNELPFYLADGTQSNIPMVTA